MKNSSTTKTNIHGTELGSYISTDSNIEKEISTRTGQAAQIDPQQTTKHLEV
jgi:hypothetical protein